jgi:hypothetical protein
VLSAALKARAYAWLVDVVQRLCERATDGFHRPDFFVRLDPPAPIAFMYCGRCGKFLEDLTDGQRVGAWLE